MKKDLTVDIGEIQTPSKSFLLSSSKKYDLQDENPQIHESL